MFRAEMWDVEGEYDSFEEALFHEIILNYGEADFEQNLKELKEINEGAFRNVYNMLEEHAEFLMKNHEYSEAINIMKVLSKMVPMFIK